MNNRKVLGALAAAAVVALVVAGLFAVGSPATARKYKADQERRNRVDQIHYVLSAHVREEGALPRSLEEIDGQSLRQIGYGGDVRKDPETGQFFEYTRRSDREYVICANFETASDDRRAQDFVGYPGNLKHQAERTCFDRKITVRDVRSAPDIGIGEPFPRPVPPRLVPSQTADPSPSTTESPTPSPSSV
ncbi:hypothetical protein BH23ACT12_BH23ACT12_06500 [soil metagenome]